jgi:hypothetical protein
MGTVEVCGVEPLAPSAPASVSLVGNHEGGVLGGRGVGVVMPGAVVHSSEVALGLVAHETAPPNKGLQLTGGRFHRRQRSLRRPQLNPGVGRTLERWNASERSERTLRRESLRPR